MLVPSVIFKPQSLLSSFIPEYKTVIWVDILWGPHLEGDMRVAF
jgi:hypothetical protein